MPRIEVIFYKDDKEAVPVLDWLRALQRNNRRGFAKCAARIRRLGELGHELRRPEADILRDGIHELRAKSLAPGHDASRRALSPARLESHTSIR